jgi:hypothetical protein
MKSSNKSATALAHYAFGRFLKVKFLPLAHRPQRHVVRDADGRWEIIQRFLISDADDGDSSALLTLVAAKYVVVADTAVE